MASEQSSENRVADEETIYRAVRSGLNLIMVDAQGKTRISSSAFNDPRRRPSVDREKLCPCGAAETRERFSSGSGVLSLSAREVRTITTTHGATGLVYGVDIEAVPLNDNIAHAKIVGVPPFDTDKVFDRIKQALAGIARIEILPDLPSTPG